MKNERGKKKNEPQKLSEEKKKIGIHKMNNPYFLLPGFIFKS